MAGGFDSKDDDEPIAGINVVPLVDIILVVLIIFMVTAPLVLKPVIDVNLPKSSSGEESPQKPLNIAVGKDGKIVLDGKAVTAEELTEQARLAAVKSPDVAAVLQADKDVTLQGLTGVIDVVKAAGIKKVAFSIERK